MLSSSGDIMHQMDTEFDHQRRENRQCRINRYAKYAMARGPGGPPSCLGKKLG